MPPDRVVGVRFGSKYSFISGRIVHRGGKFLPFGFDARTCRALPNGGAQIAPVAHQQERGHGFERVQQAEDAALSFGKREGQAGQQRAPERDPERGGVHFVFGKLELAVADIFVGEEFSS